MEAPGWYSAQGDPPGTIRYWDGTQWIGDAVAGPASAAGQATEPQPTRMPGTQQVSPGMRCLGRALDWLILVIPFAIFIVSDVGGSDPFFNSDNGGFSFQINSHRMDTAIEFLVVGLVPFIWQAAWTFQTGSTPGKKFTGSEVVKASGIGRPSLGQAAIRSASSLVLLPVAASKGLNEPMAVVMILIAVISLVLLMFDARQRTVMDYFANTAVVQR